MSLTAADIRRALYECACTEAGFVPAPKTDAQILNAVLFDELMGPQEPRELTPAQHEFEQAVFRKAMDALRTETDKMMAITDLLGALAHEECVCLTDALGIPGEPMILPELIEKMGLASAWPYNPLPEEWLEAQRKKREAHDAVMDFTRKRIREDPFYGPIRPQVEVTNDERDRGLEDDEDDDEDE